nr:glycosyltransferase [Escherichia coli]
MNFINIEQPLVSIIMACYNSIKTIDESISSVINQDYKNFELIIADD